MMSGNGKTFRRTHFSNILASLYTGLCLDGVSSTNSDLSSIVDLIEGGTDVLVLDSRKREIFTRRIIRRAQITGMHFVI